MDTICRYTVLYKAHRLFHSIRLSRRFWQARAPLYRRAGLSMHRNRITSKRELYIYSFLFSFRRLCQPPGTYVLFKSKLKITGLPWEVRFTKRTDSPVVFFINPKINPNRMAVNEAYPMHRLYIDKRKYFYVFQFTQKLTSDYPSEMDIILLYLSIFFVYYNYFRKRLQNWNLIFT